MATLFGRLHIIYQWRLCAWEAHVGGSAIECALSALISLNCH